MQKFQTGNMHLPGKRKRRKKDVVNTFARDRAKIIQ